MNTLLLFVAAAFVSSAYARYNMMLDERTHLVTMRKAELMEIIRCISDSRSVPICQNWAKCESLMAPGVTRAFNKCRQKYTGDAWTVCRPNQILFPDPAVPSQMFDCIASLSRPGTPEDRLAMVNFEMCSRELYARNCKNNQRGMQNIYGMHRQRGMNLYGMN